MNKSGLIAEVAKRTGSSKADVGRAIDAAMDVIREAVARGDRVSLVGFGTFERKRRNRRIARNPRKPQAPIVVPARDLPWFLPGKEFKDLIASRRPRKATKPTRRR
jgi:DNA-binding protein HU-beta